MVVIDGHPRYPWTAYPMICEIHLLNRHPWTYVLFTISSLLLLVVHEYPYSRFINDVLRT